MKELMRKLNIQSVGSGFIDMICPPKNINDFIDYCDRQNIQIRGFTWWCHTVDEHHACGMGGPKSEYFEGWFSEIPMEEIITFKNNNEYRYFFNEEWPNSDTYNKCYWPGFWIE